MRKILKILRTSLNRMNRLGNRISQFIKLYFQEQQLGHYAYLSQFSLIRSQNCTPFVFLDSLLCNKFYEKIEIYSQLDQSFGELDHPVY